MLRIKSVRTFSKKVSILTALMITAVLGLPLVGTVHADSTTSTVVVGSGPTGIAVDSNSQFVYVANSGSGSISYWDSTLATTTVITMSSVGTSPTGLAVKPGNGELWVTMFQDDTINVYSLPLPSLSGPAPTPAHTISLNTGFGLVQPWEIAFDPTGSTAYVTESGLGRVEAISTSSYSVTATYTVGSVPHGLAVVNAGGITKVYVANTNSSTVSAINTSTGTVSTVVDLSPATISSPFNLAANSNASRVYVVNAGNGSVSAVKTATDRVNNQISGVGNTPQGIAFAATATSSKLYIASVLGGNPFGTTVTVFDIGTGSITANLTVGTKPVFVAAAPNGSKVYVANAVSGTVSVITTS